MPSAVRQSFDPTFSSLPLNLFENTLDDRLNQVSLHWHERLEVIHVREGQGIVSIDFQEHLAEAGDLVLVPPSALHSARGRQGQHMTSQTVVFTLDCILPCREYEPVIHPHMPGYPELTRLMDSIFSIPLGSPSLELVLQGYVTALYGLLVHYKYEHAQTARSLPNCQPMKDVISYIHLHYGERITLETLARVAGYSKYYFVRYFSRHAGCSCTRYIQTIRLEKAKLLLTTTDLSVSAISEQTGFESVSYFIKQFKTQEGETPLQYRKENLSSISR